MVTISHYPKFFGMICLMTLTVAQSWVNGIVYGRFATLVWIQFAEYGVNRDGTSKKRM